MQLWYYYDDSGVKQGPVSERQLKKMAADKMISVETLLETEIGQKGKAGQLPILQSSFAYGNKNNYNVSEPAGRDGANVSSYETNASESADSLDYYKQQGIEYSENYSDYSFDNTAFETGPKNNDFLKGFFTGSIVMLIVLSLIAVPLYFVTRPSNNDPITNSAADENSNASGSPDKTSSESSGQSDHSDPSLPNKDQKAVSTVKTENASSNALGQKSVEKSSDDKPPKKKSRNPFEPEGNEESESEPKINKEQNRQTKEPLSKSDSKNNVSFSKEDQEEIDQFCSAYGSDVHQKGSDGTTLLITAAEKGSIPVARYLIQQGADINEIGSFHYSYKNMEKGTALMAAVVKNDLDMVKFLVDQGADINAKYDQKSDSTILLAVWKMASYEILDYLVSHGADITPNNKIPLLYGYLLAYSESSRESGDSFKVVKLLTNPKSINAKDEKGIPYFYIVCLVLIEKKSNGVEITKYMIEQGADYKIQSSNLNGMNFKEIVLMTKNNSKTSSGARQRFEEIYQYMVQHESGR